MAAVPAAGAWDEVADDARGQGQAGPAAAAAPARARGEGHPVGRRIWIKKWYC